ncbi:thiopeptide-type bacteriocin biosynthesis protein [Echinicola shivajiensis]|uniref:thiopeptide-type bacteriocin biosynthesis protein n=1 Tax=Echinicola shivajiensis TaxID=1035916 RepID=UPI001BFBF8FD|nr:thiopeptide-type bacteriocin biosynthesis protein [Echinicola shivajiensis]
MKDFFYRVPLLDFDIYSNELVQENYEELIAALSLSSESFVDAIKDKALDELSEKELKTLRKYLLRGRYRPIPFGKWAGVGIGTWQESRAPYMIKGLGYSCFSPVSEAAQNKSLDKGSSIINPFLYAVNNGFVLWEWDSEVERWEEVFLENDNVLEIIHEHLQRQGELNFSEFKRLFEPKIAEDAIELIWKKLHGSRFLIGDKGEAHDNRQEIDKGSNIVPISVMDDEIGQPCSVRKLLQMAFEEMGGLLQASSSGYLDGFKQAFFSVYDDRFVSLSRLLEPYSKVYDFLRQSKDKGKDSEEDNVGLINPYFGFISSSNQKKYSIDLSKIIKPKRCTVNHHLSILYRMGEGNSIVVDDMVGDRSLGILGRFTLDRKIYEHAKKIGADIEEGGSKIYADVLTKENAVNHQLAIHQNVFQYRINLSGYPGGEGDLQLHDIYIGLGESGMVLYHGKLEKEVVPVFQHVLNKKLMSHPMARLLWEIAHQHVKSLRFNEDVPPHIRYLPRLRWKSVVLRPAKWLLSYEPNKTLAAFRLEMEERAMPRYLLVGEIDQELLIDIEDVLSLKILSDELKREKIVWVKECVWIKSRSYEYKGHPIYPQFLATYNREGEAGAKRIDFNPILEKKEHWTVVYVYLSQAFVLDFLLNELALFLRRVGLYHEVGLWHYLHYRDSDYHLRLRFELSTGHKAGFEKDLYLFLKECKFIAAFRPAHYYPEYQKYGVQDIVLSEKLFYYESSFFVMAEGSPLKLAEEKRVVFAVSVIVAVLGENMGFWYSYLGRMIKSMSLERTKKHKKWMMDIDFFMGKEEMEHVGDFVDRYWSVLRQHHKLYDVGNGRVMLVRHHFHMFVNRLFPETDSKRTEDFVWYCVYREFGKRLH